MQVFNVSGRAGVAQSEATRLRAAGYRVTRYATRRVAGVGQTTVYFEAGDATGEAAANGVVARGLAAAAAPRPASVPATGTLVVYAV